MNYEELEQAYTESQKEVFRLHKENQELRNGQRWCDVVGSSWERQQSEQQAGPAFKNITKEDISRTSQLEAKVRTYEAHERLVASAFRQIKYELYCATVDLLGFSLHVNKGRNCTVTSVYNLNHDTGYDFEFIYDPQAHRYVDLLWSKKIEKYAALYHYWVEQNHCLQGFLASVFLEEYSNRGPPRHRQRPIPPT